MVKVKIDGKKCIGCGVCQSICPEGFEVVNGKSKIKNEKAKCIEEAIKACPMGAIRIEK
ncbi:ferredoxin [Candidatus Pacearchaeota archaeon ex4484_26]|nr:MAG: ferredoxin [Candidatus Pacearchaeota archaeon ex4484_26]